VGAVIAARSCLPILVAILEYACLNREFPNPKSCTALFAVLFFAAAYVHTDSNLRMDDMDGVAWLALWFLLVAFQMTYGKILSDGAELSPHDRVFWTNALSLPVTLCVSLFTGELTGISVTGNHKGFRGDLKSPNTAWWLFASCIVGLGISYTGWMLKAAVSATLFTLIGVVNKMLPSC
jgi:solute carrier family 35